MLLYRILGGIALALALFLVLGTIYAVLIRGNSGETAQTFPKEAAGAPSANNPKLDRVFTGMGRIRSRTADPQPATIIVSIAFPYASGDMVFAEELASKIVGFRRVAVEYFASQPLEEIQKKPEETIKAELLSRMNGLLRLGKIEALYFSDYLIIE